MTLNENSKDVAMWPERRIFFALSFALFPLASKMQLRRQLRATTATTATGGSSHSHMEGQCVAFALSLRRLLILVLHFACGKQKKTRSTESTQLVMNI